MCIHSNRCFDIRSKKPKHLQTSTPPLAFPTDNFSFIDIHITKQKPTSNSSCKNEISFQTSQKFQPKQQSNHKIVIELNNNSNSSPPSNMLNIRKAFFNLNKRNKNCICNRNGSYNITPVKRRVKSPQVVQNENRTRKRNNKHNKSSSSSSNSNSSRSNKRNCNGKKNIHSNNSSCSKRNERIIISTLPRAIIDISNSDPISQGINYTYNNDEIINIFLKLKSKNTKINNEMVNELKLLKDEIDVFITKYNT